MSRFFAFSVALMFLGFMGAVYFSVKILSPSTPLPEIARTLLILGMPATAVSALALVFTVTRPLVEQAEEELYPDEAQYNPFSRQAVEEETEDLLEGGSAKDYITKIGLKQLKNEDRLKVVLKKPVTVDIKDKDVKEVSDIHLEISMKEPGETPEQKETPNKLSQTEKPQPQIFEQIEERG